MNLKKLIFIGIPVVAMLLCVFVYIFCIKERPVKNDLGIYYKDAQWYSDDITKTFEGKNVSLEYLTEYRPGGIWNEFVRGNVFLKINTGMKYEISDLYDANSRYPIERFVRIDAEHVCVVYKMKIVDCPSPAYMYLIFEKEELKIPKFYGIKTEKYERWNLKEFYYFTQELMSKDYENITDGCSYRDVWEIDKTVAFDAEHLRKKGRNSNCFFTAYRVLSDGILVIKMEASKEETQMLFSHENKLDNFIVKQKTFYQYNSEKVPEEIEIVNRCPDLIKSE